MVIVSATGLAIERSKSIVFLKNGEPYNSRNDESTCTLL